MSIIHSKSCLIIVIPLSICLANVILPGVSPFFCETRTWFFVQFGLLEKYVVKGTAVSQCWCQRGTVMFCLEGFSVNTAVMMEGAAIYSYMLL